MKMDYAKNVELAIALGFEEIIDPKAYKGKYYIKDEKIWIHDIEALKLKMRVNFDSDLEPQYDVESYYKYLHHTNEMVNNAINEMKHLYNALSEDDEEPVYLCDGVYLFPDGSLGEL